MRMCGGFKASIPCKHGPDGVNTIFPLKHRIQRSDGANLLCMQLLVEAIYKDWMSAWPAFSGTETFAVPVADM